LVIFLAFADQQGLGATLPVADARWNRVGASSLSDFTIFQKKLRVSSIF